MEKLKNIEFLRFMLIFSIVSFHLNFVIVNFKDVILLYQTIFSATSLGWLAVDCFFIIAGFFLFLKTDFTQDFYSFAKKKFLRFLPLVSFALVLFLVLSIFTPLKFRFLDNIFMLLNLQNVGLTFRRGDIGALWFISSLFWTMCFYFYFYKICDKKWFNLITACIIFFCYSFWLHSHVPPCQNEAFVFNIETLRAFAGVGVGYFLSMIYKDNYERIKNLSLNIYQKLLLTAAEVLVFGFVFGSTCFWGLKYDNRMIIIISYIAILLLFLFKKGYFSQLLNNNFSVFLGQFTFSIFVTHQIILKLYKIYICDLHPQYIMVHPKLNFILLYVIIFAVGIFTYYLVEKPCKITRHPEQLLTSYKK